MQLERHKRLHLLHENDNLHKCLLSYYLLIVADDCVKLLSWMGSDVTKDIEKSSFKDLPMLLLRLAKTPEAVGIGGNKGFDETSSNLLNVNDYHTPVKVKNSKTH